MQNGDGLVEWVGLQGSLLRAKGSRAEQPELGAEERRVRQSGEALVVPNGSVDAEDGGGRYVVGGGLEAPHLRNLEKISV